MIEYKGEVSKGEISDWNEGNFKSIRLHQAQTLINMAKSNPFVKQDGKWMYEWWFSGSIIVFGEGVQKYGEKEKEKCILLKKEIETIIDESNSKPIITNITSGNRKGTSVDMERWKELKEKIEEFEWLVKEYNDKHGLSTRNVKSGGLF